MKLIIVESPAKCGKIESFLGTGYKCLASFGHIREIANGLKSIDVKNNYQVTFKPTHSKSQNISNLRKWIAKADEVILATDDDREGEAIAWHICKLFKLPIDTTKRIIFHEITKTALQNAVKNPINVNMNTVNAQLARQVLDLMVGYKISPVLWQNISRGSKLSAGRCQIPALRLVYDQQKLINEHPGKKVYNTVGNFTEKKLDFVLNKNYNTEDSVVGFLEDSADFEHKYNVTSPRMVTKNPPQPFTTSTLQQKASNNFSFSPKQTMRTAQNLYEGGYITYMRTDSKTYSKEFVEKAGKFIKNKYGQDFVGKHCSELITNSKSPTKTKTKKKTKTSKKKTTKKQNDMAQEAHEAIRPTKIEKIQIHEGGKIGYQEVRLYTLIWKNTVESLMEKATYESITAEISAPLENKYKYLIERVIFKGWKILEKDEEDLELFNYLQNLKKDTILEYHKIISKVALKDLKKNYTEAKLVQMLEKCGIGRPSTYSSLISKIQERGYVLKQNVEGKKIRCIDFELVDEELTEIENDRVFGNEKNKLVIQETGKIVMEFLMKHFEDLFGYDYTKHMEDNLDQIKEGNKIWHELCRDCDKQIQECKSNIKSTDKQEYKIDETHTYMIGKYGPVIKQTISDAKVVFKSVKKDLDIEKLKNGEYKLEDIVEENKYKKNILGEHEGEEIVLKNGKYGMYTTYKGKNISLKSLQKDESEITLEDVITCIKNGSNTRNQSIIKEVDDELSIRKGKFGNYVFYKTEKMKKPKFAGLGNQNIDDFMRQFDSIEDLKTWTIEFKPKKFSKGKKKF
jgi:DNA topoisomerase-1